MNWSADNTATFGPLNLLVQPRPGRIVGCRWFASLHGVAIGYGVASSVSEAQAAAEAFARQLAEQFVEALAETQPMEVNRG